MQLHRPDPVPVDGVAELDVRRQPVRGARALLGGRPLRLTRAWADGTLTLDALKRLLPEPPAEASLPDKEAWRSSWEQASCGLLAPVVDGRIALAGAPRADLIAELYPPRSTFHLPFPVLSRMATASRMYTEGVHYAVLGHRLHPFWEVYAPTRTDHLELFTTWLAGWSGERRRAIDVGTGSGVLALLLARAGFTEVLATDRNPNACESVRREVARRPEPPPIQTWLGDLLPPDGPPVDLIVFNPPWTIGRADRVLDQALMAEPDLIARFVERALPRLAPGGRIVVLFSNLVELVQPERGHPIKQELARGRLREVQVLRRKAKGRARADGTRQRTREKVEIWELASV